MGGWLAATGAGSAQLADHSGLSAANRISAGVLARLLAPAYAAVRPLHQVQVWARSLAAAEALVAAALSTQGQTTATELRAGVLPT